MVSKIFYFHPLGKIPILTSIFFKGVGSTTNIETWCTFFCLFWTWVISIDSDPMGMIWINSLYPSINWIGPNPNGSRFVSCDRDIRYSGFFRVRGPWVLLEISWIIGKDGHPTFFHDRNSYRYINPDPMGLIDHLQLQKIQWEFFSPQHIWKKPYWWWFQICWFIYIICIFNPTWGRWSHFEEHIFQMGWFNHHLSSLKMDGWNTIVSFWGLAYFQGLC